MSLDIIKLAGVDGLKATKLFTSNTTETLLITLEKESEFPSHTSQKDTLLIVLEGDINFHFQQKNIHLTTEQVYSFKKNVPHHVTANKNTKFLLIR